MEGITANAPVVGTDCLVVVLLGMGVVFLGLICLIFVCKLMGALVGKMVQGESAKKATAPAPVVAPAAAPITNRGELVAAISAALAEELGRDVTDLRILSITKR